jgi:hypothetical protein
VPVFRVWLNPEIITAIDFIQVTHLATLFKLTTVTDLSHATVVDGLLLNMVTSKDREQLDALNGYTSTLPLWVLSSPSFLWFSHFSLFIFADGSKNLHRSHQEIV